MSARLAPPTWAFSDRSVDNELVRIPSVSPPLGASDRNMNIQPTVTIDLTSDGPEPSASGVTTVHQQSPPSTSAPRANRLPNFNRPIIDLTVDDDVVVTHERPVPRHGGVRQGGGDIRPGGPMRPHPVEPHVTPLHHHRGRALAFFRHSPQEPYPELSLLEPVDGGHHQYRQTTLVRPRRPTPAMLRTMSLITGIPTNQEISGWGPSQFSGHVGTTGGAGNTGTIAGNSNHHPNYPTSNGHFSVPNLAYELVPVLDDEVRVLGSMMGTDGSGSMSGGASRWNYNGGGGNRPSARDPPRAPSPAQEGFTRTPTEEKMMICPNCGDELGTGETDEKRSVYFIRGCGHVYCGECTNNRSTSKRPKSRTTTLANNGNTKPETFKKCKVCERSVISRTALRQIYL
ncbi:MAG: hypothetical protein M1823_001850 [Watsoniomyces obsoletus]|nr:MAG: hypothetical protein M1823_001850 [Watsoniomyces obsoletus]